MNFAWHFDVNSVLLGVSVFCLKKCAGKLFILLFYYLGVEVLCTIPDITVQPFLWYIRNSIRIDFYCFNVGT